MENCLECKRPMVKKCRDLTLTKSGYGTYKVASVIHFACDKCDTKVLLPEEAARAEFKGLKLHILKVLEEKGALPALTLKEEVRSPIELIEKVVLILEKTKLITIDYTNEDDPIIDLVSKSIKSEPSIWKRFKNLFN